MIRLTLLDGKVIEIPRDQALELLPYRGVFRSPMLRSPIEGLFTFKGKVVPLLGPLPDDALHSRPPAEERPWILLMKGCAQAVKGLPEFREAANPDNVIPFGGKDDESSLLQELDELIKSA